MSDDSTVGEGRVFVDDDDTVDNVVIGAGKLLQVLFVDDPAVFSNPGILVDDRVFDDRVVPEIGRAHV